MLARFNKAAPKQAPKRHIYSLETTGLLVISLVILILVLVRYWQYIAWSSR
ncbi:MAG TPA: hypothetical protein VHL05_03450 [Terriglobales bacterium]|nr:hypothetical protein [Terriglobales bacterium]